MSTIAQARQGHPIDWSIAKTEFITKLHAVLSNWDLDPSPSIAQVAAFREPPHTVQRLAELIDDPHRWYPSSSSSSSEAAAAGNVAGEKYLRALGRVLSVTSTTLDFDTEKNNNTADESLDTEESLLVPIPWLRSEINVPLSVGTGAQSNGIHVDNSAAIVTGTAPIDTADYGPQSEAVREAMASNAVS